MKAYPKSNNEFLQNSDEMRVLDILCCFLKIPYKSVIQCESPDCIILYEGKRIGIEITSLRPSLMLNEYGKPTNKKLIEKTIKKLCYDCMIEQDIYNISIGFMLHTSLYFTNYRVNERKKLLQIEIEKIFKDLHAKIDTYVGDKIQYYHYTSLSFLKVNIVYYPNAGWKDFFMKDKSYINIYFTFAGFLFPISIKCLESAISKKEKKIEYYKQLNPDIDEFWLCLYLSDEEFGFTIKGIEPLKKIKSSYSKIIIAQSFPFYVRFL